MRIANVFGPTVDFFSLTVCGYQCKYFRSTVPTIGISSYEYILLCFHQHVNVDDLNIFQSLFSFLVYTSLSIISALFTPFSSPKQSHL